MFVAIRRAVAGDHVAIVPLLNELGYPSTAEQVSSRLARLLAEPGQSVLIAEIDGVVVGLATLSLRHLITDDAPLARLSALVVAAQARRGGVGRALVIAAERLATAAGANRMEVTSAERRADAHAFYEALGYEERRRRFIKRLTGTRR